MPAKRAAAIQPHALAVLILLAGLLATWFAYSQGLGASLQFDDHHNLGGLANVHDATTAFQFVSSGSAGPLGRPLALGSFIPQAYAWPSAPEVFLHTNILLHLLNGVLVTWLLYLLGCARKQPEQKAALIAVGAGTIWLLIPLLASSSLLIVQRMTTLSAAFTLLGAVGYMYARQSSDRRPVLALLGMTVALGGGAVLAALAKENGVLLFVFILAVEFALLDRPENIPRGLWRGWFSAVLIAPTITLAIYLASLLPYSESLVLRRDFTGVERLITQAGILWKYLYLAFLPNIPSLGPFQDDHQVQRSLLDPLTILAVVGWLLTISAAIALRRKAPLFAFAVAWYLAGHLLESTTVSLELYFEHRNYLPLIGPIYALVGSLAELGRARRRLALIGAAAYAAILGSVLFSITSLWGSPDVAAEMWQIYKPQSTRATQHLAMALERQGFPSAARRLLARHVEANPDARAVKLQMLTITCQLEPRSDQGETIDVLEEELLEARFDYSHLAALHQLYQLARSQHCPNIPVSAIHQLGDSLLKNPRFNIPIVQHNLHAILAKVSVDERNFESAMRHLEAALNAHHNTDTLRFAIQTLNSGGRSDISRQLLTEAKQRTPPTHPMRARQWRHELDLIEESLLGNQ
jgi:protein O-mannosyl-transferase